MSFLLIVSILPERFSAVWVVSPCHVLLSPVVKHWDPYPCVDKRNRVFVAFKVVVVLRQESRVVVVLEEDAEVEQGVSEQTRTLLEVLRETPHGLRVPDAVLRSVVQRVVQRSLNLVSTHVGAYLRVIVVEYLRHVVPLRCLPKILPKIMCHVTNRVYPKSVKIECLLVPRGPFNQLIMHKLIRLIQIWKVIKPAVLQLPFVGVILNVACVVKILLLIESHQARIICTSTITSSHMIVNNIS